MSVITCLLIFALLGLQGEPDNKVVTAELELAEGREVTRELKAGERHVYRCQPAAGHILLVTVESQRVGTKASLTDARGTTLIETGGPNLKGMRILYTLTDKPAEFFINITAFDQKLAGNYELKVDMYHPAGERDKIYLNTLRSYDAGEKLREEGTKESVKGSIEQYTASLAGWRQLEDKKGAADTLYSLALAHDYLEDRKGSMPYYEQALAIYRELGDQKKEASVLNAQGGTYSALGDKRKALDYYSRALQLFEAVGDREGVGNALLNCGAIYNFLGEKYRALEHYEKAMPILKEVGDLDGVAVILSNKGAVYDDLGDRQKALENYLPSISIFQQIKNRRGEAIALNNIGLAYYYLGEKSQALIYYEKSLALRRVTGDQRGEAVTLTNMAAVYNSNREFDKAQELYNQAVELHRKLNNKRGEANTLYNLGTTLLELGKYTEAVNNLETALELSKAAADQREEAFIYSKLGEGYMALGEDQKAQASLEQAMALWLKLTDEVGKSLTLFSLAKLESRVNKPEEALKKIEAAIKIIESLRTKIFSQSLRASYFATFQNFFELYIDVLMQLHKQRPQAGYDSLALQASQRARARSLLELLSEDRAKITSGVDKELVEQERVLQQSLNAQAKRLFLLKATRQSKEQIEEAERAIDTLIGEFEVVQAAIRKNSPQYASLTQPQPLTTAEIQSQMLDNDTVLLEYKLGAARSFVWAVTNKGLSSYELPNRSTIEDLARRAYTLITVRNRKQQNINGEKPLTAQAADKEYQQIAQELSNNLLLPVYREIGNRRIVVVSDGALQFIPFSVLPVPQAAATATRPAVTARRTSRSAKGSVTDGYTPLIAHNEIVHLPSISALAALRAELSARQQREKVLAVIADPVFNLDDKRLKTVIAQRHEEAGDIVKQDQTRQILDRFALRSTTSKGDQPTSAQIPRLFFTRQEADAITSILPAEKTLRALDFNANKGIVTGSELNKYSYIHFATHGHLDSERPELSALILSLYDEQGKAQDGFLRAYEIFNLQLPSELVVLSACETGLGKEVKGEGLVGITRAFMYAGAARVAVSLWAVNDEATAELMSLFYKKMIKDNQPPTAALRAAQLELMQKRIWRSPFYWGAFQIQGEWRK